MEVVELPVASIIAPAWNPNELEPDMRVHLIHSIRQFGCVVPLVVRRLADGSYETLGGAHRLDVLRELAMENAPCVIVDADDTDARLLNQCLNLIGGEDNPGLRAELISNVLEKKSISDILSLLPDTADSLQALGSLGKADLAASLRKWQAGQDARLRHLTFQLLASQLEVVEEALQRVRTTHGPDGVSPNRRGLALFKLCKTYLETEGVDTE